MCLDTHYSYALFNMQLLKAHVHGSWRFFFLLFPFPFLYFKCYTLLGSNLKSALKLSQLHLKLISDWKSTEFRLGFAASFASMPFSAFHNKFRLSEFSFFLFVFLTFCFFGLELKQRFARTIGQRRGARLWQRVIKICAIKMEQSNCTMRLIRV